MEIVLEIEAEEGISTDKSTIRFGHKKNKTRKILYEINRFE